MESLLPRVPFSSLSEVCVCVCITVNLCGKIAFLIPAPDQFDNDISGVRACSNVTLALADGNLVAIGLRHAFTSGARDLLK